VTKKPCIKDSSINNDDENVNCSVVVVDVVVVVIVGGGGDGCSDGRAAVAIRCSITSSKAQTESMMGLIFPSL